MIKNILLSVLVSLTPALGFAQALKAGESSNKFAFDLYKNRQKEKGNLFFSPLSIEMALSMVAAGAKGTTLDEMNKVLYLEPNSAKDFGDLSQKLKSTANFDLAVANRLWPKSGLKIESSYVKNLKANFDSDLAELDYVKETEAAREKINSWVEEKTNKKIKNIVPAGALSPSTNLVITNAIYFKASWAKPFEESLTKQEDFNVSAEKKVKTSLMHLTNSISYAENEKAQLVSIPYKEMDSNEALSFVVILPKSGISLGDLEEQMSFKFYQDLMDQKKKSEVDLTLPKFKFEQDFKVSDSLKELGMKDAFSLSNANFKGIVKSDPLAISAVFHKAFIGVDEKGTEAAAATVVGMLGMAMIKKAKPVVFRADHPFLYMIVHGSSGSILFMGRFENPN